jgi:hypothetical protein
MNPLYNAIINSTYCIPYKNQGLLLNTDKDKNIQGYKDITPTYISLTIPAEVIEFSRDNNFLAAISLKKVSTYKMP